MKFLCLTAIFNHDPSWIESLCAEIVDQDHPHIIETVIVDDRKQGYPRQIFEQRNAAGYLRRFHVLPLAERAKNLLDKYQAGLEYARNQTGLQFDSVFVADDDDGYLPDHVSQHASVLANHPWSYPTHVYSTYNRFIKEPSGGRFWASSAYRREALTAIGEYTIPPAIPAAFAPFDQRFIHELQKKFGEAGHQELPSYVYNWGFTMDNHVSGHIANNEYQFAEIPEKPATRPLIPQYSPLVVEMLQMAKVFRGAKQ